jgi:hypothetical protein
MSRSLVDEQPPPVHNDHPAVWDLVMEDVLTIPCNGDKDATITDMRERDQVGLERYGTRLQPFNGRDSVIDAYQEALDLCVYLRTALYEMEDDLGKNIHQYASLQEVYKQAVRGAVELRTIIGRRGT